MFKLTHKIDQTVNNLNLDDIIIKSALVTRKNQIKIFHKINQNKSK